MLKMDEPTLLVNKKDIIESGLEFFLHAAVINGCCKIAEHLIEKGVDINSVSTTICQQNRLVFISAKIKNINNVWNLFKSNESRVENYELDLIPLYIFGDNAFSEIIKTIVNNKTYAAQTNILPHIKINTEVLAATNDKTTEAVTKLISEYAENIDKEEKFQIQQLVIFENDHNLINERLHYINRSSGLVLSKYQFVYTDELCASRLYKMMNEECEYDRLFKNYDKLIHNTLDITNLGEFEINQNYHDLSNFNYWLIKLKALSKHFIRRSNWYDNASKTKGLFMLFNLLTCDEVKNLTNCTVMENCTPLHIAALKGCEEMFKLLLNKGANINSIDKNNNTPLHFAVSKGHTKIVNLLLQCAVDVNCKNAHYITALHFAAIEGNEEICRILLKKGSNINAITVHYNTPLHFAVWKGHQKVVELFLKYEANVNLGDINGTTALHFAAYRGNEDIVDMLLKKGADANARTKQQNTSLHFAASKEHTKICKILLEYATDITSKDTNRVTALHLAAFSGNEQLCLYLMNKGADVNAPAYCNLTPIHFAAYSNHKKTIQLISKHCSDVNSKDASGRTALHFATSHNNRNAVRILLECGANINTPALRGVTPLHIAVKEGFIQIVQLLIRKGADIDIKLRNGLTCFHLVSKYSIHWLKFFTDCLRKTSNFQAMHFLHVASYYFARVNNYFKIVELLLSIGIDLNIKLENDFTYIQHLSLFCGYCCNGIEQLKLGKNDLIICMNNIVVQFIKVLLYYGPTVVSTAFCGAMKLHCFCVAFLLLEYEVGVNMANRDRETPVVSLKRYNESIVHSIGNLLDLPNTQRQPEQNYWFRFAVKHLSRMVAAGTYLTKNDLTLLEKHYLYKTCIDEIEKMKNDYICSYISVYDILTKPINKISIFAKKINLVKTFKNGKYKYIYPIYANTLKRRTQLAEENKSLRNCLINLGCIQTLEVFFPTLVANEILKFLNVEDLLNFIKSIHAAPNYILFRFFQRY